MTPALPRRIARLLGMPGAVSFRRFEVAAHAAGALAEAMRGLDDVALAAAARGAAPVDGGRDPERAARFLAAAREAAARAVGLTPVDEQLVACAALLAGNVVEMDTGEGKTLAGALAAAGHALAGRRVHVLSVNDYLAERDAGWMGPLFALLGIGVGWVGQSASPEERRDAYRRGVVYAPVSEIGFDVLRDRFAVAPEERVDPVFDAAIVDEADAVMIDEAMVPLVLAGSSDEHADDFAVETALVAELEEGRDYAVDADGATVALTDAGLDRIEARLGGANLYAEENVASLTRINLALHARVLVRRDVDYLVTDGAIRLVDSGRGRVARLQRWPDGLHAAVEAKEGLPVSAPGVILDTITIQDLLLGYRSLSGMSGTVVAVAEDLAEFYRLPVGRVERHRPVIRVDEPDRVVLTAEQRTAAVAAEVAARHAAGQPVLVGTRSVAESEELAAALRGAGIEARVLNARNDADEAAVIARAGEPGAVTISTQMSGRGTDIRLGGAGLGGTAEADRDRVVAAGGLAVLATGRHPSRRLDAQLRGRAGRQGDPGSSLVVTSLDDELVRTTAPRHLLTAVERQGEALPAERRRRIVETCQAIAEAARLDRHRATWAYSRAIAAQRAVVLARRAEAAAGDGALEALRGLVPERIAELERARGAAVAATARAAVLHFLDARWTAHLAVLGEIRDGIHLRALAGERPEDEFHRIALREFQGLVEDAHADAAAFVAALRPEEVGRDLDELGLRRPSATWTYMVTDDPLGSPGDRFAVELGRRWRSRVLRIE